MKPYTIHTSKSAAPPADAMLQDLAEMLGFVPNVFAVIAESPVTLGAFMEINRRFAETSLSAAEREIVQIVTSAENGCGYCVAGHTAFAKAQDVPASTIAAVRNGNPIAEPRLKALQRFTQAVVAGRGRLDRAELERFLSSGFTEAQVYEVILGVCVKTFSNLASNLLDIPLDAAFVPHSWYPEATLSPLDAEPLSGQPGG